MKIELTEEEIKDLLSNLDQCESEGYLNYGDPAYSAMVKLQVALRCYIEYGEKCDENRAE
jgi:hypothetical protein